MLLTFWDVWSQATSRGRTRNRVIARVRPCPARQGSTAWSEGGSIISTPFVQHNSLRYGVVAVYLELLLAKRRRGRRTYVDLPRSLRTECTITSTLER